MSSLLKQLARIDALVSDDWGLAVLDDVHRRDLLEVLDDRHGVRSIIVSSQLPIEHWHAAIGDATLADAILDRLVGSRRRYAPAARIPDFLLANFNLSVLPE